MNRPRVDRPVSPSPTATTPWSRRDLLRVGSLALAASALPAPVGGAASLAATARSVILLWMAGGVTHIDSLDPKPEAPEQVRGTLGAIPTRVPGLSFCESLPELARVADRLTVLRSYSHGSDDHFLSQAHALSGRRVPMDQIAAEPNVGAIAWRLLGPRAGLPGYIAVPGVTRPGPPPHDLFVGGWLGQRFAPFATGGTPAEPDFTVSLGRHDGPPPPNIEDDPRPGGLALADGLDPPRLARRARLRETLDQALRAAESRADALGGQFGDAFHLLSSPEVRRAFDVGLEAEATRAAYGRTKIGGRCQLARRLVEAGARFVMVDYGYDPDYGNLWDNHRVPTQRQPHICEIVKQPYHLAGTDRACAALIGDLADRGLLDSTLVVFLTEFGRTPRINKDGGRDHWGAAGSLFFAGGGAAGGQVIGATDRIGARPTGRAYSPSDVAATIYQALGIDRGTMLDDPQGRPHSVLGEGEPVPIFG